MLVSTGGCHCAGVDLASGALVRAWCPVPMDPRLAPYDLVDVTIARGSDVLPDPASPDAVAVSGAPSPAGRLTGRRAMKLMRPLLHPGKVPLLGFPGTAVPFWERRPDRPSAALAQPEGRLVAAVQGATLWCHFMWAGRPQALACTDPRLAAWLQCTRRHRAHLRPGSYLVVALEPPVRGQCHKVVESVVPRR